MDDFLEYSFRIIGAKPDTMPMARLAIYMQELAKLLGSQESVHFNRIEDQSVAVIACASQEAIPLISPRIRDAARGLLTEGASSWRKLNELLSEDGWQAEMRIPRSADLIIFPGIAKIKAELRGINQPTSIQGRLVRIEGAGDVVKVGLEIEGDLSARISVDSHLAKQLAPHFQKDIRIGGDGRWKRDNKGAWSLESLKANSFEILEDTDLHGELDWMRGNFGEEAGEQLMRALEELRRA